ncbi:hypothetical protein U8607_11170 [Methylobacterium durans]|uniref:Uncharacterized protein n=2 Tax=Methylobacterium durans TaxID=2202825 RepID=A0A2U8WC44_9HYPH|nr:hypothetical protein [Methylobacterium durans]AWN43643.1 hypothetical protein DK389_27955 [Methylobacterium durans]MEA1832641.1 hypothetical protein [Methylobacterium durans]
MPPVAAKITLKYWPRPLGCRAVLTTQARALISTNLASSLPDGFCLALAPDFIPRLCAVTWRGERALEVALSE